MNRTALALVLVALTLPALACPPENKGNDSVLPMDGCLSVVNDDTLVQRYRARGYEGLNELLASYDSGRTTPLDAALIDRVAGQKNAVYSRLYWHTDLESAKAQAQRQRKPILYLRLLGNLTDEYSCANSRFFRTALYANKEVSALLRDKFVLVWESERPVPVISIDMGDGRVLKRTITGNSAHYVLDPVGNVVDCIPGLVDAKTFKSILEQAGTEALNDASRHASYRAERLSALATQWTVESGTVLVASPMKNGTTQPDAAAAARRALSKCAIEAPLVRAWDASFNKALADSVDRADETLWTKVAAAHRADATLDAGGLALIAAQTQGMTHNDRAAMIAAFEDSIAQDTARNLFRFRRQVLAWLADAPSLTSLNERVYAELFLTPRADPWLGLLPGNTYTGLADGGVTEPSFCRGIGVAR